MRIAIPITLTDNQPTLAPEFSKANLFALYDIHDDTRAVAYLGRQSLDHPGCGRTPPFLKSHNVEVVLGHRVSENATNHLLETGILAIKDAPLTSPDALVAHLVSGTLQATPPASATQAGTCGGGGCAHCTSHAHPEPAQPRADQSSCADQPNCSSHTCSH